MFLTFSQLLIVLINSIVFTQFCVKAVSNPDDKYSFVALLDIVLTDGVKRTCTGTIIHDTVVITAAHCFTQEPDDEIQVELTACFVVIGTKKMFDTGYEQYFPIERVVIHPKYSGWTADLALVFTFASMVSDKPGRIVPLISDHMKTVVDANVTVLSWGQCKHEDQNKHQATIQKFEEAGSSSTSHEAIEQPTTKCKKKKKIKDKTKGKRKHNSYELIRETQSVMSKLDIRKHRSAYLQTTGNVMSYYKNNWRRKMGTQQNKLTIEVFGFVNVASCKKIIEKGKPAVYRIQNTNEIICYTSEDRYVSAEDSGAPAMRHGHLVGVTVGGALFDGDHVAVAMKISCFCSWIAENLPDGGPSMQCCTNCCDIQAHSMEYSGEAFHQTRKKKKKV
ncbi:uncharacterized protein LOC123708714 isoform X2 [Pieris brassicae]|uniref:uncharacterized protein LOC123708714 isoform X2 n=1 Tax=Pieris brassicae TaxID=7116 RepID=UPI001E662843|nr:uncharacterized protein LOC123708714 isoform X2 [Pieris brassicae]